MLNRGSFSKFLSHCGVQKCINNVQGLNIKQWAPGKCFYSTTARWTFVPITLYFSLDSRKPITEQEREKHVTHRKGSSAWISFFFYIWQYVRQSFKLIFLSHLSWVLEIRRNKWEHLASASRVTGAQLYSLCTLKQKYWALLNIL